MGRQRCQETCDSLANPIALPFGWPLKGETSHRAQCLHRLLNGEQPGRLDRFDVPWGDCRHTRGYGRSVIREFNEPNSIVFAKAVVEADQATSELLRQFTHGSTTVLWDFRQRFPCFGSVGKLNHVKGHAFRLLSFL